jgi:hypothetical protein
MRSSESARWLWRKIGGSRAVDLSSAGSSLGERVRVRQTSHGGAVYVRPRRCVCEPNSPAGELPARAAIGREGWRR